MKMCNFFIMAKLATSYLFFLRISLLPLKLMDTFPNFFESQFQFTTFYLYIFEADGVNKIVQHFTANGKKLSKSLLLFILHFSPIYCNRIQILFVKLQ